MIASAAYAYFDLRDRAGERHIALQSEARAVANTLRFSLEAQASAFRAPTDAQLAELSKSTVGWRVDVIPRAAAETGVGISPRQLGWLRTLLEVPSRPWEQVEGDTYYYALALRGAPQEAHPNEPSVLAMLEIAKPADALRTTGGDLWRAAALILLI